MKTIQIIVLTLIVGITQAQTTLKDAIRYADREQFQKAKSTLTELLKTDSKNSDVYLYYLGDVCLRNEQSDSARYWFMQALKVNDNSALAYAGMGKVAMAANPTEGKANFEKAISLAKKDGRVYATIADYYLSIDKPEAAKALEYAQKSTEVEAKNASNKVVLGDAYLASVDGSKAIEQYKLAMTMDVKSPIPLWKIGKLYLAAKNYDLGMQYFKEGLVLDADFAPIYREMGELYYRAKKFDKAIESYKKYLSLRDKSDDTDFRYASFLFLNEDYSNALSILNALAAKNYSNPVVYRLMGYSQYESKDYSNAQKNMDIFWQKAESRKVISQDYEYYGKILAKKGQDSSAVDYLNKALEKDTAKKELYGEIANIWFTSKKYDKAANAFNRKIEVTKATAKPTALANDYLSLGRSYMLSQKYPQADSAFAKVTEIKSDLPIGYLYRARANSNIDLKQEKALAKPYYEKYIELAKVDSEKNKKDLVEAYSYLGAYYSLINKDKAKSDEAWNNVRTLDPTNKAAMEAAKLK